MNRYSSSPLLRAVSPAGAEILSDGTPVTIRPISRLDVALERTFLDNLSAQSRQYRFFGQRKISDEQLRAMTDIDVGRDMALVAEVDEGGATRMIAVARFCLLDDGESCECAVVVSDPWQRKGCGGILIGRLIAEARRRGLRRMVTIEMSGNTGMRHLAERFGFRRQMESRLAREVTHVLELE